MTLSSLPGVSFASFALVIIVFHVTQSVFGYVQFLDIQIICFGPQDIHFLPTIVSVATHLVVTPHPVFPQWNIQHPLTVDFDPRKPT
jgi:hypothetical protein